MISYIIFQSSDNEIITVDSAKKAFDHYTNVLSGFDYAHWDDDYNASGVPPAVGTTFSDTRNTAQKRIDGYKKEADLLLPQYEGDLKDGVSDAIAGRAWRTAKAEVREHYLKAKVDCTLDDSTDTVSSTAHGLENDEKVVFSGDTVPAEISSSDGLFVVNKASDTFQVSLTVGGAAIDILTTGTNVQWEQHYLAEWVSTTLDDATDVFTSTSHGLSNGERVEFRGALPGELVADRKYYVISATANTFEISSTKGGSKIDFSGSGSGLEFRLRH